MNELYPLVRAVAIFFLLVVFVQLLKRRGIFNDTHLGVFGWIITELILPITIFSTLAVSRIEYQFMYAAAIYFIVSILTCCIAYVICHFLHFSRAITGTLIILSGVGSTSTVAYPIISQTFGVASDAMTRALIIGEFGSIIPLFTIGVLIVSYFGKNTGETSKTWHDTFYSFFRTPIFFSLVAGLGVSMVPMLSSVMASDFITQLFAYFNNGFELLVAITIGLMLRPVKITKILPYLVITLPLSLIFMPVSAYGLATFFQIPPMTREILVIEAAAPSGAVAAVLADRYGCDGALASMIVVVSFFLSLVTLPVLSALLL